MNYNHAESWAELQQLVVDVLAMSKKNGASSAEAAVTVSMGLSCTVRLGEVETIEFTKDKGLSVTVYYGKSQGSTSSSDFSLATIQEIVAIAGNIAKNTEEDPCNGLADIKHIAQHIPDLNLYHPRNIQTEQAIMLAKECEQFAREFDPRIVNSEGATFSMQQTYGVYGNTHPFVAGYPWTSYALSCSVIGQDSNIMQRDYAYSCARDFQDLKPGSFIGKTAAERTIARLGARKIKTCKVPVLFHQRVAKSLLGNFIAAISGGNLYRKSSFLLDKIGKKIFSEIINIREEPLLLNALGSAPFDNEGVAPKPRYLVQDGVLQSYVLGSYSARKLGLETTGNAGGVRNLILELKDNTSYSFEKLLQQMDTGIVAMELIGQGVNLVTGDYSKGCAGFWVENGEIQYPVEEITIAGNLSKMFLQILALGNDVEHQSNIVTGSILVDTMMVAGS